MSKSKCIFSKGRECVALEEKKCKKCRFFKTKTELNMGRRKSMHRIQQMPWHERSAMMEKYHNPRNTKVWCVVGETGR